MLKALFIHILYILHINKNCFVKFTKICIKNFLQDVFQKISMDLDKFRINKT